MIGYSVAVGAGCMKVDRTKVRRTTKRNPARVRVRTYDRADIVVNKTSLPSLIDGGTDHDRLTGGSGNDQIPRRPGR